MFKSLLLLSTLTFSSLSTAGILKGNAALNYQLSDLDMSNISIDTQLFDEHDVYTNTLKLFPKLFGFTANMNEDPLPYVTDDILYSTSSPKLVGKPYWQRYNYTENSFNGSFLTQGTDCLQGTGLLVNRKNTPNGPNLGLESGCFKTLNMFSFSFYKIDSSVVNYNSFKNTNNFATYDVTSAEITIEKRFYDDYVGLGGDPDDIMFSPNASITINHQIAANPALMVTHVPETESFALFLLGAIGLVFSQRKNKS